MKKLDSETGPARYKPKARLCVHRNRDNEEDALHTDASVVSHEGVRTIYILETQKGSCGYHKRPSNDIIINLDI